MGCTAGVSLGPVRDRLACRPAVQHAVGDPSGAEHAQGGAEESVGAVDDLCHGGGTPFGHLGDPPVAVVGDRVFERGRADAAHDAVDRLALGELGLARVVDADQLLGRGILAAAR
ncbi:hypothetical protein [Streptomyces olivochromogenes]|uniref:hypothetical protein n=1 Tax=Streptomyces olivochromogenes TaxID=1963 RepID=UPI0036C6A187